MAEATEEPLEKKEEEQEMASSAKKVTVDQQDWDALKNEVLEYKDKYLRLLAETENTRKRMQKEKQETIQYAVGNAVIDFLHPMDNLENALKFAQQMSDEVKNWAVGFQMILTQFKEALYNNDVVAIQAEGAQFDPHDHEAIEMIETDVSRPGTIVEVCVRGYKMKDRTIRPARVKVAKAVSSKEQTEQQEE